jgi:hypothetical protein
MEMQNYPITKGKQGAFKMPPDGKLVHYTVIDEIRQPVHDPYTNEQPVSMVLYLQKLEFEDDKKSIEIRLCYYILGKMESVKGKWVFGQYATSMPTEDFKAIIEEAKNRNWI